jgi:hypothetical protein
MSTTTGETATASPRTMGLRRFERLEPDLRPARRKPLEPAGGEAPPPRPMSLSDAGGPACALARDLSSDLLETRRS